MSNARRKFDINTFDFEKLLKYLKEISRVKMLDTSVYQDEYVITEDDFDMFIVENFDSDDVIRDSDLVINLLEDNVKILELKPKDKNKNIDGLKFKLIDRQH